MDKYSKIQLSSLPETVLKKIPYSIKTKQDEYILNELPLEIQYLIEKYYDFKYEEIPYDDTLDLKCEISKYSDLGVYTDIKQLLKEYLKNYLSIRLKSYPFDPEFGCALKDQLMMLDTSLRQTYISNELHLVTSTISSDLNLDVKVIRFDIDHQVGSANSQYICNIELQVNDEIFKMSIDASN